MNTLRAGIETGGVAPSAELLYAVLQLLHNRLRE